MIFYLFIIACIVIYFNALRLFHLYLMIINRIAEKKRKDSCKFFIELEDNCGLMQFKINDTVITTNLKQGIFGMGVKIGDKFYSTFDISKPNVEYISDPNF